MSAPGAGVRVVRTTRVLLADDSEGLRLLVRSWLSSTDDLEVVAEASNGAEAVALADAHRPDVVVLDVAMPVMDGLEALTEIHRRYPTLPVVMLSGFAEADVAAQASARGAVAFVEKSGDLDLLVQAVRRAARGPALLPSPRPAADLRPAEPADGTPPPPAPTPGPQGRAAAFVLLGLGAAVTALAVGLAVTDAARAPALALLVLPVLLVAVRRGVLAGLLAGGAGAVVALVAAAAADDPVPRVTTAVVALLPLAAAAVAGTAVERQRTPLRHQQALGEAVATSNRDLAAANEQLSDLNRRLAASNDDLRQFGYVVGHDLAEPLRTMRSFAGLLEERYGDALDDTGRTYARFVAEGAARLQTLVGDLRDYTRTGQADLQRGPVRLDDVLDDAVAGLGRTLEEQQAEVRRGPLDVVVGDRPMLGLVLQNVVANAVKFSGGDRPVVEVSARRRADRVELQVLDNGIGIDPDDAERVFGLFTRLHTREQYAGTGLGLAISRRIVERHDGSITIAPRSGGGSVVTIDLPAATGRL